MAGSASGTSARELETTEAIPDPSKKEQIEESLRQQEIIVQQGQTKISDEPKKSAKSKPVPENVDLYIGEYANSEPPAGSPVAIENHDEYRSRNAPPGFAPKDFEQDTPETPRQSQALVGSVANLPNAYFQETIGSFLGLSVGIGAGVKLKTGGDLVGAEIAVDFILGPVSISFFNTSVGVGYGDMLCLSRFGIDYGSVPDVTVTPCLDVGFSRTGGDYYVEIGASFDLCADPCSIWSCEYCSGISGSVGGTI